MRSLVFSLKPLMKSIMLTPYWPRVLPTGGAALARPPGIFILSRALMAFAIIRFSFNEPAVRSSALLSYLLVVRNRCNCSRNQVWRLDRLIRENAALAITFDCHIIRGVKGSVL